MLLKLSDVSLFHICFFCCFSSPLSSSQEKGIFQGFHLPALYKVVLTHLSTKLNTNYQQNVLRKTKQMISSRFFRRHGCKCGRFFFCTFKCILGSGCSLGSCPAMSQHMVRGSQRAEITNLWFEFIFLEYYIFQQWFNTLKHCKYYNMLDIIIINNDFSLNNFCDKQLCGLWIACGQKL